MPVKSRRFRALDALLSDAGMCREVEAVEPLAIGWRGRGGGAYRDDDGTHLRVRLADGASAIVREYATTTVAAPLYRDKEAFVFDRLAAAGLPVPVVLATTAGDALASLLSDSGGEPLEAIFRAAEPAPLWAEVGRMLRRLHDVDLSYAGFMADPGWGRPWMRFVPYFLAALRPLPKAHPELAPAVEELRRLLRGPVAQRLADRPRSICCGPYSLPGLMLEERGAQWRTRSWLGLGYYVSVGDPDRDVVAIAARAEAESGRPVPESFWTAYGRQPDPVGAIVYEVFHSRRLAERVPETVDRLRRVT